MGATRSCEPPERVTEPQAAPASSPPLAKLAGARKPTEAYRATLAQHRDAAEEDIERAPLHVDFAEIRGEVEIVERGDGCAGDATDAVG